MEGRRGRGGGGEEMVMRKGPWMAEEDEILMDYVKKHGPRDWSSIRSKGLLPRTGKSCRLRWVNKLKPDLKTGCKFTAEEERVVIDLQARFGNKWARIATYLPGRTDNDVKNFWSTRQKRLARILHTSNYPKPHKNNNAKSPPPPAPAFCQVTPTAERLNAIVTADQESRNHSCQASSSSYMENPEVIKMMPLEDLITPNLLTLEPALPLEYTPIDKKPCIEPLLLPLHFSFPQLPQPTLDLPLLPESHQDLVVPGLVGCDTNLMDMFGQQEPSSSLPDHASHYSVNVPFLAMKEGSGRNGGKGDNDNPATPDSFFDDFPTDMFDYIESLPSSSEW